jgi:hypothetical protein
MESPVVNNYICETKATDNDSLWISFDYWRVFRTNEDECWSSYGGTDTSYAAIPLNFTSVAWAAESWINPHYSNPKTDIKSLNRTFVRIVDAPYFQQVHFEK